MGSFSSVTPADVLGGAHCSAELQKPLMQLMRGNWFLVTKEAAPSGCVIGYRTDWDEQEGGGVIQDHLPKGIESQLNAFELGNHR